MLSRFTKVTKEAPSGVPVQFERESKEHESWVYTVSSPLSGLRSALQEADVSPIFIVGFVSPHISIQDVAKQVKQSFPEAKMLLCSSAGELCQDAKRKGLYCDAPSSWDGVVLQLFDAAMIEAVEIVSVELDASDLKQGHIAKDIDKRVDSIAQKIKATQISMPIDHRDTLAYVLIDGLSASESFFMEALYASGKYPCLFVGGSAGGKFDFKDTWVYDGERVLQGYASIAFLKFAKNVRFGILKSQNFIPTTIGFHVFSASVEQRYVRDVVDSQGMLVSFIFALCSSLHCKPQELDAKLADYSFAIQAGGELYVRSVSKIDLETGLVHFYCDISPGEEVLLVKRTSLIETTKRDYESFLQGKPSLPIAGILNDCILRRLYNGSELSGMSTVFPNVAVAGFSTFGEILGLNLNQTLTAVFFFKVAEGQRFQDHYVDRFVSLYGDFKCFFLRRQLEKLSGLAMALSAHIRHYQQGQYGYTSDVTFFDAKTKDLAGGLNGLGRILSDSEAQRVHASTALDGCADRLYGAVHEVIGHVQQQHRIVTAAVQTVAQLSAKASDVLRSAQQLTRSSDKISNVVGVITQIAGQTNLLALNAAIESSRAGEAGKGFEVVATEVRQLAIKSKDNATQIGDVVRDLESSIGNVSEDVSQQNDSVSSLKAVFSEIENLARCTTEAVNLTQTVADELRQLTDTMAK